MIKKILVISEAFRGGGLETQIAGQARVLASRGVDLVLATGSSADEVPEGIFVATIPGVPMGSGVTFLELRETIARLVGFARSEGVDAIHAHPFFSSVVGLFVAQQARLPLVLTLHGPLSVSGMLAPLPDLIFRSAALRCASGVLCVSPEVQLLCKAAGSSDTLLLPNGVALPAEEFVEVANDAPWMWAGRIDDAKLVGLLDLIDRMKPLDRTLDVFGDGPAIEALRSRVEAEPAASFVRLCGWRSDLPNIMADYSIVAGMGRVLLEAAARDKPCLLVGYDGVKGLLDEARLEEAAFCNLSGRGLPTLDDPSLAADLERLARHPEHYRLRPWIAAHRDERALWASYVDHVETLPALESPLVQALLDALRLRGLLDTPVWADEELARLAKELMRLPIVSEGTAGAQNDAAIASLHDEISHIQSELAAIRDGLGAEREEAVKVAALLSQRLQAESARAEEAEAHLQAARRSLAEAASDRERIEAQHKVASQALLEERQTVEVERDKLAAALQVADTEREKLERALSAAASVSAAQQAELLIALDAAHQQFTANDRQRNDLEYLVEAMRRSTSWKLTNPIRKAGQLGRSTHGVWARTKSRAAYFSALSRNQGFGHALHWLKDRTVERMKRGAVPPNIVLTTAPALARMPPAILHEITVLIFAIVPFDDVGGGQRAAQIARVLATAGFRVVYVYAFKRYDFELQRHVDSVVNVPRLTHVFLDDITPDRFLADIRAPATAIFEAPVDRMLPWLSACKALGFRTVFELIDAWDTSLGGSWFKSKIYQQFIDDSDLVVGTAKVLVEELKRRGRPDAIYLPNAANDAIFDHYRSWPRPSEYDENRPVLLYFGSLYGEWFDWECIRSAALAAPDYDVILIGEYSGEIDMPSNVRILGPRLIDELPGYLQHCTAALLPFAPGKISDAVSPIKIFEYLAMGKKVIATRMPEIVGYPNCFIAENPKQFGDLCAEISNLDVSPPEEFIIRNTWASRAATLLDIPSNQVISVVILIRNNANIIDRALTSLKLNAAGYIHEIIVVDNDSSDAGPGIVSGRHPDVTLLRNDRNGCSSGRNLGLRHASGEIICFLDSDQWLTSGLSFAEALSILRLRKDVGAVAWGAGWFDFNMGVLGGPIVDYLPERGRNHPNYIELGFRDDVHYLATCGLFAYTDVVRRAGCFDEAYDPTCFEDTDLSFAIRRLGLKIAYRDLTGIRHQPHQTTGAGSGSPHYQVLFRKNSDYFRTKWAKEITELPPFNP